MLYESSVSKSKPGRQYLNGMTDLYLDKADKAYANGKIGESTVVSIYKAVAEMGMGNASERAEKYLNPNDVNEAEN